MKTQKYVTVEKAIEVSDYIKSIAHTVKPEKDIGTCVSGNGIRIEMLRPGKRKSVKQMVFQNIWTQAEQEAALNKLMVKAKKQFPEIAHLITYDCGSMD